MDQDEAAGRIRRIGPAYPGNAASDVLIAWQDAEPIRDGIHQTGIWIVRRRRYENREGARRMGCTRWREAPCVRQPCRFVRMGAKANRPEAVFGAARHSCVEAKRKTDRLSSRGPEGAQKRLEGNRRGRAGSFSSQSGDERQPGREHLRRAQPAAAHGGEEAGEEAAEQVRQHGACDRKAFRAIVPPDERAWVGHSGRSAQAGMDYRGEYAARSLSVHKAGRPLHAAAHHPIRARIRTYVRLELHESKTGRRIMQRLIADKRNLPENRASSFPARFSGFLARSYLLFFYWR